MKQRIKIKQYKKELSKHSDFVTESFKYSFIHTDYKDRIALKIWREYFQDLEALYKILKNKKLHIIKSLIKDENKNSRFVITFADLLECIDSMYDICFDDKEIYRFSDLLRK